MKLAVNESKLEIYLVCLYYWFVRDIMKDSTHQAHVK